MRDIVKEEGSGVEATAAGDERSFVSQESAMQTPRERCHHDIEAPCLGPLRRDGHRRVGKSGLELGAQLRQQVIFHRGKHADAVQPMEASAG